MNKNCEFCLGELHWVHPQMFSTDLTPADRCPSDFNSEGGLRSEHVNPPHLLALRCLRLSWTSCDCIRHAPLLHASSHGRFHVCFLACHYKGLNNVMNMLELPDSPSLVSKLGSFRTCMTLWLAPCKAATHVPAVNGLSKVARSRNSTQKNHIQSFRNLQFFWDHEPWSSHIWGGFLGQNPM